MFLTYFPCSFILCTIISLTMRTHPPQPVPAFVHFFTASSESQSCSFTALLMAALLTLSQLQISASSGKPDTPDPPVSPPLLTPKTISSGLGGNTILFLHVC